MNKVNLGVSKGYDRGFALATGDYIVVTGCDMLMPANWLFTCCAYLIASPNTGVASMCPDPTRGRIEAFNGFSYQRALRFSRIIVTRRLLAGKIGYLGEDSGLYGKEDREWGQRAFPTCQQEGLLTYTIPGHYPRHLGTMGVHEYDGKDPADYYAFKAREMRDPQKCEVLTRAARENRPYFKP